MVVHHWSDDGMVMYHRWSLVMTIVEKQPEITQHSIKIQFMSRRAALQEVTKGISKHLRNPTPYRRYLQFPYNVSWTASLSFPFSFSSEIWVVVEIWTHLHSLRLHEPTCSKFEPGQIWASKLDPIEKGNLQSSGNQEDTGKPKCSGWAG